MKFGQSYHSYEIPEWEEYYVDYDYCKAIIKRLASTSEVAEQNVLLKDLRSSLEYSIRVVSKHYTQLWRVITSGVDELQKLCGDPAAGQAKCDAESHELRFLLATCQGLEVKQSRAEWFLRVNDDAVARLCDKLDRLGRPHQHLSSIMSVQWWEVHQLLKISFARVKDALRDVAVFVRSGSPEDTGSEVRRRSFLLERLEFWLPERLEARKAIYDAIALDDVAPLEKALTSELAAKAVKSEDLPSMIKTLIEIALLFNSPECVSSLTRRWLPTTGLHLDPSEMERWVAIAARMDSQALGSDRKIALPDSGRPGSRQSLLLQMLKNLGADVLEEIRECLLIQGAKYGLHSLCLWAIDTLTSSGQGPRAARLILSKDVEWCTPLSFAILQGHTELVNTMITSVEEEARDGIEKQTVAETQKSMHNYLRLALRIQNDSAFRRLLSSECTNVGGSDPQGRTLLHVACRMGCETYVDAILSQASRSGADADVDACDSVMGWTPLFVAAAEGHHGIVEKILGAGGDKARLDLRGWTAKEHAALRGHLAVAHFLTDDSPLDRSGGPAAPGLYRSAPPQMDALSDQSLVIINLGSTRKGWKPTADDITSRVPSRLIGDWHRSTAGCYLEVSVFGAKEGSQSVELPVLHDTINNPFVFSVKEDESSPLRVTFRVVDKDGPRNIGQTKEDLSCSGTCLLEDPNLRFGDQRQSMVRMHTVPMVSPDGSNMSGSVTFTYNIVRPYTKTAMPATAPTALSLRRGDGPMRLMGHRGLGQNVKAAGGGYLQLGENTVQSFMSASQLGAWGVEFDVQVTRDHEAVIYHDFSLSETGTDIPVHDLSLDQYVYASKIQSPHGTITPAAQKEDDKPALTTTARNKPRSSSVAEEHPASVHARNRMEQTLGFKTKGFVSNTRDGFIQEAFTTLDELLDKLPESVAFDIEFKYPRLHEALAANLSPVAIELNTFIDTALSKIFSTRSSSTRRPIFLSSFTPEVCILLASKQSATHHLPVLFITNAGRPPLVDAERRAESARAAVRFARRWGLAGVVFAAEVLLLCPRLVRYVQEAGLVCASYGLPNNVPENAKIQDEAGLDIIMVDRVGLVANALKSG